jgi:hypothetical protein
MLGKSSFFVVALYLTGCAADETDETDEEDVPIPGSPFSQLRAKLAGQVLAGGVELAAYQYGSQIPVQGINPQCTTISGDRTDADGDQIPVNGVLSLDCTKQLLGWTGSVAGTQSVVDTQPSAIAWAFAMTANLEASVTGPTGGSAVNTTAGSLTASQGSMLGPYDLDVVLDATTNITTPLDKHFDIVENLDWTVRYTPDIDWAPGGGFIVTGVLDVSGAWNVGVNGKTATTTLSTPTALIFDPECRPTRITAGVLEAAFEYEGEMAAIAVTWTGCGNSAVAYTPPAP